MPPQSPVNRGISPTLNYNETHGRVLMQNISERFSAAAKTGVLQYIAYPNYNKTDGPG
jgi:hypothetical protein